MTKKMARRVPRAFTMPWGSGDIVEEASFVGKHQEPVIQLLRFDDGHDCLRFCHYVRGRFQNRPVILGEDDLRGLRRALAHAPEISELLRRLSSAGGARPRRARTGEQPLTHATTRSRR